MYYHQGGQDIQSADGLQTLYLMNPNNYAAADTQQPPQPPHGASANMLILNYATAGHTLNVATMAGTGSHQQQQQQQHHLVGVPLHHHHQHQHQHGPTANPKLMMSHHHHQQLLEHQHEVSARAGAGAGISHFHQSLWGGGGTGGGGGNEDDVVVAAATQMGRFHRGEVSPTQQGLSLSLSPQQPGYDGSLPMDHTIPMHQTPVGILSPTSGSGGGGRGSAGCAGGGSSSSMMSAVVSNNGIPISIPIPIPNNGGGMQQMSSSTHHVVFSSKYLKAAQQLLDELVSVGKGIKLAGAAADKDNCNNKEKSKTINSKESGGETSSETKSAVVPELSTPQKQEIQMKKAKLIGMLDEVEQRYRQYHHQMQIVVASFEQATGIGSARSYTQLALQTISKQFRCLKDAISSQIKAASKSLGEELEGYGGGKMEGGSRLKFVDQQLRQQRALQHLGMMQNNAWRPQRGLPERAVSVLRAWLFEHFLHPYPKDSDKQMLAKQTGLTRSQVSNWFINARVRLWKPMVEEMYSEEMKNQEEDGTINNTNNNNHESNKLETGSKNSTTITKDQNTVVVLNSKQQDVEISNSSVTLSSPTGSSPQGGRHSASASAGGGGGSSFSRLVCGLNMGEGNNNNYGGEKDQLKRLRSSTDMQMTSPSSILSVDMEMKFGDARKGGNFMSLMVANNNSNNSSGGYGGGFTMGDHLSGQFNIPEQTTTTAFHHGNGVSLTLGLPPSENMQHNFLSDQNMDIGSRLEMGTVEAAAHFERVNKPPQPSMGYETIDFENSRKRFAAAPLLPDFVA